MAVSETTSPVDLAPALRIVEEMQPIAETSVIPLLQQIQSSYGYLPREVVLAVCERTGLPVSRVFGVATFYSQFHLTPRGRHLIRCCRGTACHVKGSNQMLQDLQGHLQIAAGQTSRDGLFTLETVACFGSCALAPIVVVDASVYGSMNRSKALKLLDDIRKREQTPHS